MKFKVEPDREIKDGLHKGVITAIAYRDKPYEYTDVIIEFDEGRKIKAGFPSFVNLKSKLGLLLQRFGVKLEVGNEIEPEVLIGCKCEFMTLNKTTERGTFPVLIAESLKPDQ